MSAATRRRRGPLAAVSDFFVEPIESRVAEPATAWGIANRPSVAVVGLASRCGTTTIARALGAELAARDLEGAAVVTSASVATGGIPLGTPAAVRLTRALSRAAHGQMRAVGRLCLTSCDVGDESMLTAAARGLAPLVLDVTEPAHAARAASLVDAVVLVGSPDAQPALAAVLEDSLQRIGPSPVVVLNRNRADARAWDGRSAVRLPESRLGAQLALVGREARGELGRAVGRLADLLAQGHSA